MDLFAPIKVDYKKTPKDKKTIPPPMHKFKVQPHQAPPHDVIHVVSLEPNDDDSRVNIYVDGCVIAHLDCAKNDEDWHMLSVYTNDMFSNTRIRLNYHKPSLKTPEPRVV